jgi:hypothetical protein
MPRGSRPGERRGGRKKGTPNKKTLWYNIVITELAKTPHFEPVELFLCLMRSPQLPLELRIDMAHRALPYLHAKPRPLAARLRDGEARPRVNFRVKPEQDVEFDDDWLGVGSDGAANRPFDVQSLMAIAANTAASLQAEDGEGQVGAVENGPARETNLLPLKSDDPLMASPEVAAPSAAGQAGMTTALRKITALRNVSPMTFLRAIMTNPRTPFNQRLKVASILAPYLHAKPMAAPSSEESFKIVDQYGFAVDPELAKRLRDLARQCGLPRRPIVWPLSRNDQVALIDAAAKEVDPRFAAERDAAAKHDVEFAEEKKKLRCAPTYRGEDSQRDWKRLWELARIREARVLTPQEDDEEIHLTARALSYENSAEYAERQALDDERKALKNERNVLRDTRDKLYKKWRNYNISKIEQQEFDRLRAILNKTDSDPVYPDFSHQLYMEARIRGLPVPTPEQTKKRMAEIQSSLHIVHRSFRPPEQDPVGAVDVDLAAWLRGEVTYPPWLLHEAAPEYVDTPIELFMIDLVRNDKLIDELELSPYFAWILWIYDDELKRGNNPAANLRAHRGLAPAAGG